jgi:uncharacterized protein (TIGR00369 family)
MLDPWQEPVRGGYPDAGVFRRSGLGQLEAMLAGEVPAPPISRLTGMRLSQASADGTATFEMPLTGWLQTPQGAIGIGPLVIPADAAMACAIQTALEPATPFSTSELTLRLLAPARVGRTVAVTGRVIQVRQTLALADAAMVDDEGRLVAHGSTLCLMQPSLNGRSPAPAPPEPPIDDPPQPRCSEPDPWQRPPAGETLGQEIWERLSGLEVLEAQLRGELPAPPLHHLTGLTLTAAGAGSAELEMPCTEWLCAPARRRVQGGGVAVLAEAALSAAIQTQLAPGIALAPVDLKVNYLRPLTADGRLARGRGELVHAGRRVAVAGAKVLDADGRTVAVATGSALLLPGRPASLGAAEP